MLLRLSAMTNASPVLKVPAEVPQQLSLGISHVDDATFDNFYLAPGSPNAVAMSALRQQFSPLGEKFIFLWGLSGSGLTHLLQAACHQAQEQGHSIQYLPLSNMLGYSPQHLLEGLDSQDLVCLDELQVIAGKSDWELAIFHLFNRLRDSGKQLLLAADFGPHQLPIDLPDLRSRLNSGVSFGLQRLNDQEKCSALQQRALRRGLELTDEVAKYILSRASRDMNELFRSLSKLDDASLTEQRKLTIPFVKQVLGL